MKRISYFLISLSFIIVVNNTFRFYKNKTSYEIGDWLINYQGGFVRKGLVGEFIYQIYKFTEINPYLTVLILIILFYLIFYIIIFKYLNKLHINNYIIFALFSPLSFFFPVFNSKATGRKEILFISLLALVCFYLPKINKKYYMYIYIGLLTLIGLTHEGFIFYFGYFLIPLIFIIKPESFRDIRYEAILISLSSLILIFLTYKFSGNENQVIDICNSIKNFAHQQCESFGQIATLKWDLKNYMSEKEGILLTKYFPLYFFYGVISFLPLFFIYKKASLNVLILNKKINPLILIFIPFIFTIPVYYIALDWGRYLYTSYISSLIIILFLIKNKIISLKFNENFKQNYLLKKVFLPILFVIYCFGWSVPYCCNPEIKSGLIRSVKLAISYYERNGLTLPKYFYK